MNPDYPSADDLLRFLADIPLTDDVDQWLDRFRRSLYTLLPDVDHVSILIDFDYDLLDAERRQRALVQEVAGEPPCPFDARPPDSPAEAVEYFKRQGEPAERYQAPTILNLVVKDPDRLASIYLWRRVGQPVISPRTILTLLSLHTLLTPLFINLVRGRSLQHPERKAFIASMARLVEETGITEKQNRILLYLLRDDSYEEIARKTGVSIAAVKDTVRRLYKRADVKSLRELNFKYFVPRSYR